MIGKAASGLPERRIISAHIRGEGVNSQKIEFEFELDFPVVNPHFPRNSARKFASERHWNSNSIFLS